MTGIWYVLYCPDMDQEEAIRFCKQHWGTDILKDAFVFTCDRMRRYKGAWHIEKRPLFPDYVFLESRDGNPLGGKLAGHQHFRAPGCSLSEVTKEEESFLREMCGKSRHIPVSRGVIRKGVTKVTDGPLKGKEPMIAKIDRHKRIAVLHADALQRHFSGHAGRMEAGLEIVEKD